MTYQAPVSQILLAMKVAGQDNNPHVSLEDASSIINEAGRFASERIAPLNAIGDKHRSTIESGKVTTPPGWRETYQDWCAGGWNSLTGPEEFGGQGLPMSMAVACTEIWNAACMSFALCPLLTTGAIEAISAHASEELKQRYLPNMISGEWSGTMNLTEPQSGSDLSTLRCKATRAGDGTYRITGQKIYITYGEHDLTSNIIHLVLARLDDAPEGTKGISLFLVPKVLPDGSQNDVRCHSLEHKLGIHGSPTCTMIYGDHGGATGFLIGAENRGLACMFTMMNNARLLVGVQGVALAERALQAAVKFAQDRKQGRAPGMATTSAIIEHPDVKRMLHDMQSKTMAARLLCMATAVAMDNKDQALASLLTPLAKAYSTDIAVDVASTAVQVCGGMGYVEETGVAQLFRDARILPIYEGTNGIQAIDLVTRKLNLESGVTLHSALANSLKSLEVFLGEDESEKLMKEINAMTKALTVAANSPSTLAAATPFLRALSAVIAAGLLADAAQFSNSNMLHCARFFMATELPAAMAAAKGAIAVSASVLQYEVQ